MRVLALVLIAVALLLAGCGSSGNYSVDQVKAAFASQGLALSDQWATQPRPSSKVVWLADRSRFVLVAVLPGKAHDPAVRKELQKGNVEVLDYRSPTLLLKLIKALQQLH